MNSALVGALVLERHLAARNRDLERRHDHGKQAVVAYQADQIDELFLAEAVEGFMARARA